MPKHKRAFIMTSGTCYPHVTDSRLIEAYLRNNGWEVSRQIADASLVIVNTCAVVKDKEDIAIKFIREAEKQKKPDAQLIVTGCLPVINKNRLDKIFNGATVSANSLHKLDELINARAGISQTNYTGSSQCLKKNRYKDYYLRIGWGCDGKCSYCAVRFVFGKPHSRPVSNILKEFSMAYERGYRRFILTANDAGSYGGDLGASIACLINKLCQRHKECSFALSHITPDKFKEIYPSLEEFFRSGKIWYINIPLESGSNRILHLMNRSYTRDDFKYCIQKLVDCNPDIQIRTDILVGFPSETAQDFSDTLRLVEWMGRYNVRFQCAVYSKRPRTETAEMPGQIDEETKKNRQKQIFRLRSWIYILRDKKLFKDLERKALY